MTTRVELDADDEGGVGRRRRRGWCRVNLTTRLLNDTEHLQEEGSKCHEGDQEVCTKGHGNHRCESGCEAEQTNLEQRNPWSCLVYILWLTLTQAIADASAV